LGNDTDVEAGSSATDVGNLALNLGQGTRAISGGVFSSVINVGGNRPYINNELTAKGTFAGALNFFGNENTVTAGPGPFTIAASLLQNGVATTKEGPGNNINGLTIGGAAAPAKTGTTVEAAALGSTKKKTTSSAAAVKHVSKK
jgi:hypothetical protein